MKIVQISGSGRNCGKTTLGCALIARFPHLRWMAVKLTPHGHSQAAQVQQDSDQDGNSGKDTDRFLAAGAMRAFLLTSPLSLEFLADAASRTDVLLLESGQPADAREYLRFHLAVAPGNAALWKPDFVRRLAAARPERPDALVRHSEVNDDNSDAKLAENIPEDLTVFSVHRSALPTPALLAAVASFLSGAIRR